MENKPQQAGLPAEEEHYEVPPKLTVKDSVGIIVALVLLTVLGVLGYVWLTPGMSLNKLMGRDGAQAETSAAPMIADASDGSAASEPLSCDFCGMFAEKSASYVIVTWADGMLGHFDSWDCVFNYAKDNNMELTSAEVAKYGGEIAQPEWINADSAWYLYNTDKPVKGSMLPYVAAFATQEEATAQQAAMGGEVVDFATLRSKWQ